VLLATLRRGPDELLKIWGASATPALAERLMASDTAALIAIRRQRLVTDAFSDVVGTIAVPTLLYAGTADPIHDGAGDSASQIRRAKFISVPGLNHIETMCRSELILPHVEQFLTSLEEGLIPPPLHRKTAGSAQPTACPPAWSEGPEACSSRWPPRCPVPSLPRYCTRAARHRHKMRLFLVAMLLMRPTAPCRRSAHRSRCAAPWDWWRSQLAPT
jgi:hypothetical protein